ncbi:MAG: serine/threonine protein kinase, partial [Myxococcales bacterium]|nr:serine/threonine protein kinase [Myxococcales bacterium]
MSSPLELGEELGMGAVATVYRARDRQNGQVVAVKLLHDRNARDPTATRRFAREVELARTLRAPNIVAVFGAVEHEGRAALVMELVEGPTLAELIAREAPLSEERLLQLARGVARGLATAHGGGVIHRDLKPANVLIAEDPSAAQGELAKIADFGMARASSFAGIDRESMTVLGTPDYMAPETLDPLAVDPRTDLYALGCMLFEMAEGRPPFSGATPFAVLEAHRNAAPPFERLAAREQALSSGTMTLLARLLAKQPSDRPHAASVVVETIDALLEALAGEGETSTALVARTPALPVPLAEREALL